MPPKPFSYHNSKKMNCPLIANKLLLFDNLNLHFLKAILDITEIKLHSPSKISWCNFYSCLNCSGCRILASPAKWFRCKYIDFKNPSCKQLENCWINADLSLEVLKLIMKHLLSPNSIINLDTVHRYSIGESVIFTMFQNWNF